MARPHESKDCRCNACAAYDRPSTGTLADLNAYAAKLVEKYAADRQLLIPVGFSVSDVKMEGNRISAVLTVPAYLMEPVDEAT